MTTYSAARRLLAMAFFIGAVSRRTGKRRSIFHRRRDFGPAGRNANHTTVRHHGRRSLQRHHGLYRFKLPTLTSGSPMTNWNSFNSVAKNGLKVYLFDNRLYNIAYGQAAFSTAVA